jgi:hypothetical protein
MKNKIRTYIIATLLLTGCGLLEKEITGNVFIVTKGGSNVKLGLIAISVLPKDEVEIKRNYAIQSINKYYNDNIGKLTELKSSYLKEKEKFEPLEKKFKANQLKLVEYIKEAQGEKGISIYDSLNEVHVNLGGNRPYGNRVLSDINKIIDEINSIRNEMKPIYERAEIVSGELYEMKIISSRLKQTRVRGFIEYLAKDVVTIKSNADGDFKIKVDRYKDYFISAYGERSIGKNKETYNWLKEVKSGSKNEHDSILLSNDSLIENIPGDENIMIKISEFEFFETLDLPLTLERFEIRGFN